MKKVKLSDRLKAITGLIDFGASIADIGSDHGLLPVYMAQTGSVRRIFASDISSFSLDAARRSAADAGVTDAITFIVAPGLDRINPADVDTIVIAGLGGETITGILKDAPWTGNRGLKLILQPQTKIDVLCRFLYDNMYVIKETRSVFDRGKHYSILVVGDV